MKKLIQKFLLLFQRSYKASCGHMTRPKGIVGAGKKADIMSFPIEENGRRRYCIKCANKMTIPCALCGEQIRVGDLIDLIEPIPPYLPRPNSRHFMIGNTNYMVTCRCWKPVDGAVFAGRWMIPGEVQREPGAEENIHLLIAKNKN